jgi:hypothetical protein
VNPLISLVHLLAGSAKLVIAWMGTSFLAVAVLVVPFFYQLFVGLRRNKWHGAREALRRASWSQLIFWIALYLVAVGRLVYWEHVQLRNDNEKLLADNSGLRASLHKDHYGFALDDEFASIANTEQAFRFLLPQQKEGCWVRITAPTENMKIAHSLSAIASTFCRVDVTDPADAVDETYMQGAERNILVVHMAKDPMRDHSFVVALKNTFNVKRVYELPSGSPSGLVWLQIGPGSPWRTVEQ